MANNGVVAFGLDDQNRLSTRSLDLTASGNFTVKDTDDNIKSIDTGDTFYFKALDGQYISGSTILLSAIGTGSHLTIVPFKLGAGNTLAVQ